VPAIFPASDQPHFRLNSSKHHDLFDFPPRIILHPGWKIPSMTCGWRHHAQVNRDANLLAHLSTSATYS
jgi:hypothetical protein